MKRWMIAIAGAFACAVSLADERAIDEKLSVLMSDIHIQTNPAAPYGFTAREFPKRVKEILAMRPLPRRVICFGDMTFDGGEPASYAFLREQIRPLQEAGIRVVLGMGNHDRRRNFLAAFPEAGKDQPVPGRIVYKVDLGHCDLILLDTLSGTESAVGGEFGAAQEDWLEREVKAAKRPVILGAHHLPEELRFRKKPLLSFMRGCDKVVGWINGHGHSWRKENLYWGGGPNEDVIRSLMLPTGGAWGEIGLVTLRTYPDRAVATLKMIDMVWHDALRPGEMRPKSFDAIVEDQDGERMVFPYERPKLRASRRPVFVNYDDTHFVHSRAKFGVEMTADEMRRMVRQYKRTDVTDLLFCISGRIADVPNTVKESWIDKYHQTNENGYAVNYTGDMYARAAHEQYEVQKVDRVAIWLDEARKCGIRPWLSFRMNDCHNNSMPTNFLHPEFFHRHPEYRRIRHRSPSLYFDRCFDYALKPIRDRELGYIGEMLRRYDTDGVEIDWMREPYCFAPGQEDQTVMTGFMREVRRLADGAAKRLGHPVKVLARVPADPETALRFGFDAATWADEKLVDVLVPCPRWETTDNEIATDLWKRLLRGTGVQLAPGVEIRIVRERPFYVSVEQLMGAAAWHYSAGADGFYLYNYFDDPSWKEGEKVGFGYWPERDQAPETVAPVWANQVKWLKMIGHPDKVLAAPRDHVLTYHDIVPLWGSREHALPVKLDKGWLHYFRLATGTVPPNRQLKLRFGVVGDAKLSVFANSRPCVPIGMEKCEPAFTSAPLMTFSVPEFSEDSVVVEVCPDAPVEITFLDLQVRPSESVPAVLAEFAKSDEHPRNSEGDVIRLRDGRLLVVYSHFYKDASSKFADGGSDDSSAELVLTESADGGKTWSKMRTAVRKDKEALNVMSASFLRLGDGRLALFYLNKISSADCRPVMVVSSDEGKTWSAPVDCVSERDKGYYILNNARAVRLQSGRIALPLAYHPFDGKRHEEGALLLCALSDDDGRTWRLSSDRRRGIPPSGAKKLSLQEPGLVELKDGRLMMYARSNERRQWRLFSTDNGEHWTEPEPVTEYATTTFSPVTYARLADGRLVVVFNDGSAHADAAPTGLERRWPLAVGVSSDEGKTWKTKVLEPDDPKGTVHACYTAVREIDGRLVLVYCHRDALATTRVVSVPLDWLP